jgi:hypothetical protein
MEISGRPSCPGRLTPGKEVQKDCCTLEDWTDSLSSKIVNYLSSQKSEDMIYNNLLMPSTLSGSIQFLTTIHVLYVYLSVYPSVLQALSVMVKT